MTTNIARASLETSFRQFTPFTEVLQEMRDWARRLNIPVRCLGTVDVMGQYHPHHDLTYHQWTVAPDGICRVDLMLVDQFGPVVSTHFQRYIVGEIERVMSAAA